MIPTAARRVPPSVPILRDLARRGVSVDPLFEETTEEFEARIETALMSLFRETQGKSEFEALYEYAQVGLLPWIAAQPRQRGDRLPRTHDPLELSQDTWVNIFRYAQSFRDSGPMSFRVWSRAIARNLQRGRGTSRPVRSLHALPDGLQEPADPGSDPAVASSLNEDARTLSLAWIVLLLQYQAAWRRLSPRDQVALELVEVQGLSYVEAGAQLRVGLSNMKMIMFRARKRLCVLLGDALAGQRTRRRVAG